MVRYLRRNAPTASCRPKRVRKILRIKKNIINIKKIPGGPAVVLYVGSKSETFKSYLFTRLYVKMLSIIAVNYF